MLLFGVIVAFPARQALRHAYFDLKSGIRSCCTIGFVPGPKGAV